MKSNLLSRLFVSLFLGVTGRDKAAGELMSNLLSRLFVSLFLGVTGRDKASGELMSNLLNRLFVSFSKSYPQKGGPQKRLVDNFSIFIFGACDDKV